VVTAAEKAGLRLPELTVSDNRVASVEPTAAEVAVTITTHVAVFPPSVVVTVIVAVPAFTPFTTPAFTVATEVSLDFQATAGLVAPDGKTVDVRVSEAPTARDVVAFDKLTPVTETTGTSEEVAGVEVVGLWQETARSKTRIARGIFLLINNTSKMN